MKTKVWNVRTVSGWAGGPSRAAQVALEITTEADTVEEVRAAVEALPKVVEALEACQIQLAEYVAYHQKRGGCSVEIESAEEQARAALAKVGGEGV